MANIDLRCSCGAVRGIATNVTPSYGSRVVCCCNDCQAFARFVGTEDQILDSHGGTDIFQLPLADVQVTDGIDRLQAMRLKRGGLLRWYTTCCQTAVGNTVKPSIPVIGVIHTFMDIPNRDRTLGPLRVYGQTQHAKGNPVHPKASEKFGIRVTLRILRKLLPWKLRGLHRPTVFFADDGRPSVKPVIADETA